MWFLHRYEGPQTESKMLMIKFCKPVAGTLPGSRKEIPVLDQGHGVLYKIFQGIPKIS